jgi:putative DNA primase/helicase
LVLRDGDGGRLLATCWAGCDRRNVLAELRARGLLGDRIEHRPRLTVPHLDEQGDNDRRFARARRIWDATLPAARSPVTRYLAGRSIELNPWPASIRWHPRCPGPHGEPMPAMVALVEHAARGIVGIHRTYITPDCRRQNRATLGPIGGGAVRLGMPRAGEWLAIGEGIESTAAAVVACGIPGWAALSASGICALILPPEATQVIICADHDRSGTGARAARDAAARWLNEGRRVRIALPPDPNTDMADVLAGWTHVTTTEAHHVAA